MELQPVLQPVLQLELEPEPELKPEPELVLGQDALAARPQTAMGAFLDRQWPVRGFPSAG